MITCVIPMTISRVHLMSIYVSVTVMRVFHVEFGFDV